MLTVFLAISDFLLNVLFGDRSGLPQYADEVLKVGGVLIALLFWVHQERAQAYWYHFVRRAAELEEELGIQQYRDRPPAGLLSSFKAMRAFFVVILLLWLSSFIWLP